ncbi:MAG: DUF1109 family protein [Alphaproteobacteria bacterium]|nr:DUF1109 family protein [Alphaproteobacteria bacterium]
MSKNKDLDKLIGSLSKELEPCKPMAHPLIRVLPLIVISILYVLAIILLIGPRNDWMPKMYGELSYIFEFGLSFSIFVSAAIALAWLCVPGMRGQTWLKAVPVTLGGVFLFWALLRIIFEWSEPFHFAFSSCSLDGFIMLALPVFILTLFSRRGATTEPWWSSFMAVLSFAGLGWAGLRLTCSANTFAQSLVVHFVPFVTMGVVFALFARRIFKW